MRIIFRIVKTIRERIVLIVLSLITLALLGAALSVSGEHQLKPQTLVVAAGSPKAESFVLMAAMRKVAAHYYPQLTITVQETGGTTESLSRLEQGTAELAISQADALPPPSARSVAVLFDDDLQLLVHRRPQGTAAKGSNEGPGIQHFVDLKDKIIALPRSGGQYQSFLFVASHFGLKEKDFTFVGGDDEAADLAFARGAADAIFRVRSLHNTSIGQQVVGGFADFVPIEDASSMHEAVSAFTPAVIPRGTYLGTPPVPPNDMPTVSIHRLLLARADADNEAVRAITEILMQHRAEISAAIPDSDAVVRPLAGHVVRPQPAAEGLEAPLHPGARSFFDREQTTFVGEHGDALTVCAFGLILFLCWVVELRRGIARHRKQWSDVYNWKLVELMREAQSGADIVPVEEELKRLLAEAVRDLGRNNMSNEDFASFYAIWKTAMEVVADVHAARAYWRMPDSLRHTPADPTVPPDLVRFMQTRSGE